MATPERNTNSWCTSSYTAGQGNCVELRADRDDMLVRDTKRRDGGALDLPSRSWRSLRAALGGGR